MAILGQQEILNTYQTLMEDIKRRISSVQEFKSSFDANPNFRIEYAESSYLQVRKISEVLALALAAAHNQIPDFRSKRFVSEWHAERLVKSLTKLNKYGFPTPIKENATASPVSFEALPIEFHAKHFVDIYKKCGEKLHTGTLKRIAAKTPVQLNPRQVSGWTSDFVKLLGNHLIVLPDMKKILVCSMNHLPSGGKVSCFFAEEVDFD